MSASTDTKAQRMRRKLIKTLCQIAWPRAPEPACFVCFVDQDLEIDHPAGRRAAERNRNPKHRRKSALQRVRELWEAFASDVPLRVLCRSCNAREGGGRRYS